MPLILISLASSHRLIHYLLVWVKNSTQSPLVISCNWSPLRCKSRLFTLMTWLTRLYLSTLFLRYLTHEFILSSNNVVERITFSFMYQNKYSFKSKSCWNIICLKITIHLKIVSSVRERAPTLVLVDLAPHITHNKTSRSKRVTTRRRLKIHRFVGV